MKATRKLQQSQQWYLSALLEAKSKSRSSAFPSSQRDAVNALHYVLCRKITPGTKQAKLYPPKLSSVLGYYRFETIPPSGPMQCVYNKTIDLRTGWV